MKGLLRLLTAITMGIGFGGRAEAGSNRVHTSHKDNLSIYHRPVGIYMNQRKRRKLNRQTGRY